MRWNRSERKIAFLMSLGPGIFWRLSIEKRQWNAWNGTWSLCTYRRSALSVLLAWRVCVCVRARVSWAGYEGEAGNVQRRQRRIICSICLQWYGRSTCTICGSVLLALSMSLHANWWSHPTTPFRPRSLPREMLLKFSPAENKQHIKTTAVYLSLCSVVIYAAGLPW